MATTLSAQQQSLTIPNFRDPTTGNWNQETFSEWAKQAQSLYGGNVQNKISDTALSNLKGQGITGQLAAESYGNAYKMAESQAEKSKAALGVYSQGMNQYQTALDKAGTQAAETRKTGQSRLKKAEDLAEQNAQAAQQRSEQVTADVKSMFQTAMEHLDMTKAKDTQTALQGVRAQMAQQERAIKETYGLDSPEYARFKEEKAINLGNLLGQISSEYSKNLTNMRLGAASTMADVETKMAMYENYADQAWTETALKVAELSNNYDVQMETYQLNLEQMKLAGMTDYANYLTEIPEFGVDLNPILSIMATIDIQRQQLEAQERMNAENNATQRALGSGGAGKGYYRRPNFQIVDTTKGSPYAEPGHSLPGRF